jgi:hypothetical protein
MEYTIVINSSDFDIVARNAILLLTALHFGPGEPHTSCYIYGTLLSYPNTYSAPPGSNTTASPGRPCKNSRKLIGALAIKNIDTW